VRWPRPWRAVRAATSMRSRRNVAPRALAQARLARVLRHPSCFCPR
jgi:hypothetical protein